MTGAGNSTKKMRVADVVIVVLILVASVVTMVALAQARTGGKGQAAVVEVNGKEVMRVALSESTRKKIITVHGWHGTNTVEFDHGRVRVREATCRDKICIGRGLVGSPGDAIVCLPNRVVIRVTGTRQKGKVDTVTE